MPQTRRRDDLERFGDLLVTAREQQEAEWDGRRDVDQDRRRRARRVGGIVTVVAILAVVALGVGYVTAALNAPLAAATGAATPPVPTVPAAASLTMPRAGEAAISVSGAEKYLGPDAANVFQTSGGDAPLPIASISKLVAALVILEKRPLGSSGQGPQITFDKTAHDLYDKYYVLNATIAPLPTNTVMSERDALETMLVASAANYAEALTTWAFGSQPAFLSAARAWLKKHGMTHTTIVEPTGLDARNTSTPSDLLVLGRIAVADPAIAAISALRSITVGPAKGMPSTNDLLGVEGIDGLKTGTLDGYANLLFSATLDVGIGQPVRVIGVVLQDGGHQTVHDDVRALLQSLRAGFHQITVARSGQVLGTYRTDWGSSAKMVLAEDASVFTWSDTPVTATMSKIVLGSGEDGDRIGTVTFTAGSSTDTVPIVLKGTITPPTEWWRLTHPKELFGW